MLNTPAVDIPGLDGATRDRVYEHVFENADREVGGVLIGRAGRRGGPPLVTGSIAALMAMEESTALTFTQDAWEDVHRVMSRDFPHDQIVGWYHSHPGFGIFLSEHDLFIHHNFFGGASQIAWVVDPLAGTEGVFGWTDGEVLPWYTRTTTRSALGPRGRAPATPPTTPARPPIPPPASAPRRPAAIPPPGLGATPTLPLLALLLTGVLIGFGLWEIVLRGGDAPTVAGTATTSVTIRTPAPTRTTSAAPPVHVTEHRHRAGKSQPAVTTYTVTDPSAVPKPLPDPQKDAP